MTHLQMQTDAEKNGKGQKQRARTRTGHMDYGEVREVTFESGAVVVKLGRGVSDVMVMVASVASRVAAGARAGKETKESRFHQETLQVISSVSFEKRVIQNQH